jgi:hypothetical protein
VGARRRVRSYRRRAAVLPRPSVLSVADRAFPRPPTDRTATRTG